MKILFLISALPDLSNQNLYSDLINQAFLHGNDVKVASPVLKGQKEGLYLEGGISVARFKSAPLQGNKSFIQKGIAYLRLIYKYPLAISRHFKNETFDLIYVNSLPLEVAVVSWYLKRKYKAKLYLMLCDYLWQDIVALKVLDKNNPIIYYYRYLERLMFKTADYIGALSQAYIDLAKSEYPFVANKNLKVIFPWSYNQEKPSDIDLVLKEFELEGKFIAVYGGNVGVAQDIDNVVNVAESCQEYEDIVFLIIGKGAKVDEVSKDVKQRQIKNVRFIDFMPKDKYLRLMSACDIGLVSLNKDLATPNFPSKTSSLFNFSIPVVAAVDYVTDYGHYLEKNNMGLWSYSGDTVSFKNNILKLYNSPELKLEMGKNAYKFYAENMTPGHAYSIFANQVLGTTTNQ